MKRILVILGLIFSAFGAYAQTPGNPTQINTTKYYEFKQFLGADSAFLMPQRDTNWTPSRPAMVFRSADSTVYYWNLRYWVPFGKSSGGTPSGPYLLAVNFIDSLNNNRQVLSKVGDSVFLTFGGSVNVMPDTINTVATKQWVNNKGYITFEQDPVFTGSPAYGITTSNINAWNTAYNSVSTNADSTKLYLTSITGAIDSVSLKAQSGSGENLGNADLTNSYTTNRLYHINGGELNFQDTVLGQTYTLGHLRLDGSFLYANDFNLSDPTVGQAFTGAQAGGSGIPLTAGMRVQYFSPYSVDSRFIMDSNGVAYMPKFTDVDTSVYFSHTGSIFFKHLAGPGMDSVLAIDNTGKLYKVKMAVSSGGITKVIGVNGIGNVNDSTVYLDTTIAMTITGFLDSLNANALTVLFPIVLDTINHTLGVDTTTNDGNHLATQYYVLTHSGTGSLRKVFAGNNLLNVNDSTLRADTSSGHLATQNYVNNQGFLKTETDPVANAKTITVSPGYGVLGGGTHALSTNPSYPVSVDTASATGLVSKSRADNTYLKRSGGAITGPITYSGTPSGSDELVNKTYVDNLTTGLSWKQAVKATTTGNITLSGEQTIDGVSVVAGDRVLVANQSDATENGIYVVASGAWSRADDNDTGAEIKGSAVYTTSGGTINGGTQWVNTNSGTITVGSTNITFGIFGGGNTYTGSGGIELTGNDFHLNDAAFNTPTGDSTINITGTGQVWGSLQIGVNPDYLVMDSTLNVDSISIVTALNNHYGDITLGFSGSGSTINLTANGDIIASHTVTGGGTTGVTSFNGRDGDVVPVTGDYTFANISGTLASGQDYTTGVSAGTYNNVTVNARGRITSGSNVGYLTGNQTITLTGNVTGTGTTNIATTIANQAVTYAKIQNATSKRLLGRYATSNGSVQEITIGSNLELTDAGVLNATGGGGGGGTVTSVGLGAPTNVFSVTGSPVVGSGTLTFAYKSQSSGLVLASPPTVSGTPSFRSLAASDIPNLDASKITSGTFAVARLGTGTASAGRYVDGATGAWTALPSINNGTLTLATSGIATGSASFTANQSGASTFTVNVPATNIAQGTRTSVNVPITSSTGSDATLTAATTSLAGVMTAADKAKLDSFNTNKWILNQTTQQSSSNFNISGNGVIGEDLTVAGSVTASAGFESSDIRLKTILNAHPVIAGISGIQAKLYKKYVAPYGSNGLFLLHPDSVTQVGYIAQEVQKVMPYAVKEGDNGYLNLDYKQVFVAKISALEQENADLKKRLEALEAKVQELMDK